MGQMMNDLFILEELYNEYIDTFNENFPRYMVKHLDTSEIINLIKRCIEERVPYEPEIEDGTIV